MVAFEEARDGAVIRKVQKDVEDAGVSGAEAMVRSAMTDYMEPAIDEVKAGGELIPVFQIVAGCDD